MLEDSIHDLPRPVDDGEDTIGQSRFGEKLAQPHRAHRRPLRRLEYVGVAGRYSHRQGPQRHHAREVEWGYGRNHPEGIAPGGVVYAFRHVPDRLAHHKGRHPARKLDDLYAAPDLPCGVCGVLAVLESDQVPQLLEMLLQERLEREEDPSPIDDRGGGPGGERFPCLPYGAVDVVFCREGCLCDDLSCGRIVDGFRVASVSLLPPSRYKVPDVQASLTRLHLDLLTGPACRKLRGSCGRGRRGRSSGWRRSSSPRRASPGTLPSASPSPPSDCGPPPGYPASPP